MKNVNVIKYFIVLHTIAVLCFCVGCSGHNDISNPRSLEDHVQSPTLKDSVKESPNIINPAGQIIETRFNLPSEYERVSVPSKSFEAYLRALQLKEDGAPVLYYNDEKKPVGTHAAVVDLEIGKKDLQQCADAVMRLRGEYLYTNGYFDQIEFTFTNGFKADFKTWSSGKKIAVKNNLCQWTSGGKQSKEYRNFRAYMDVVFAYAGTLSLERDLTPQNATDIKIGDVFIKGGTPGHCVIVVDMAVNQRTNKKIMMLAQSYMPAQEIHILMNPKNEEISPWYIVDEKQTLETPQWDFTWNQLKQF